MKRLITGLAFVFLFLFAEKATSTQATVYDIHYHELGADVSISDKNAGKLFVHHAMPEEINARPSTRQPGWLFIFFLSQFIIIGYLRVAFPKDIELIIKAILNLNISHQLYREQELIMPVSAILYNINFVLSGGITLFLFVDYLGWSSQETPFISLLFFLWAVIVIYSLRYGVLKIISYIFPFSNEANLFNFNFFLIQKLLGLLLVPLNLLIAYGPGGLSFLSILITLILISIFFIGRYIKGFTIGRNLMTHYGFYFFVYICTLEIAPMCILVKVVVEWVS